MSRSCLQGWHWIESPLNPGRFQTPIFKKIPWRQRYTFPCCGGFLNKKTFVCPKKCRVFGLTKISATQKTVPHVPGHKTSKFLGKDLVRNRVPTREPGGFPGSSGGPVGRRDGPRPWGPNSGFVGFGGQGQNARFTLDLRYLTQLPGSPRCVYFFSVKGNSPFGKPFFSNQNPW